jgi:hypothetical protein
VDTTNTSANECAKADRQCTGRGSVPGSYVTDMTHWQTVGEVHAEVFAGITPASTIVEVRALVQPDPLVEAEADAYVGDAPSPSE